MKNFILFVVTLSISVSGWGQTISTEAPSVSAGGSTVDKNVFQIESTFGHSGVTNGTSIDHYYHLPNLLFRYGVLDRLELRLGTAPYLVRVHWFDSPSNYIHIINTALGAKYHILNSEKNNVSVIAQYNLPSYSKINDKFESNEFQGASSILTYSGAFNDQHSIGANFGVSFSKGPTWLMNHGDPLIYFRLTELDLNYSFIYNYSFLSQWTVFGEVFASSSKIKYVWEGETVSEGDFRTNIGFDTGVLYLLKDNIQLDAVLGYDITNESFFQSLGFNIMF